MQTTIWYTYATEKEGTRMHFGIFAPHRTQDEKTTHTFGMKYLLSKNKESQSWTAKECSYIEKATDEMTLSIKQMGYCLVETENCK